jgi:hypothetical protein
VELAINLGLRYEVDTPWFDPEYRMSHGLDLSVRNDTIASNPPQTPVAVQQYLQQPWRYKCEIGSIMADIVSFKSLDDVLSYCSIYAGFERSKIRAVEGSR